MPDVVFIGPELSRVKHRLVVFEILTRDADGYPVKIELVKGATEAAVQAGAAFMTGYLPAFMTVLG